MQPYQGKFFDGLAKSTMVLSVAVLTLSASAGAATSKAPSKILPAPSAPIEGLTPFADGQSDIARTNKVALTFVERTGITKNLSLLVLDDVKNRRQIRDAISLYGMDKVQSTVVTAIKAAQAIYAPQWNQLMAEIYVEHFSAPELASILAKREASPYFPRLLDLQETIANAVHARGDQMVASARVDVMSQVAEVLPIISPAAIGR